MKRQLLRSPSSDPFPERCPVDRDSFFSVLPIEFIVSAQQDPIAFRWGLGSQFPLREYKPPPPRKFWKITQKLHFGPPRACPENYRKGAKNCNFVVRYYYKITLLDFFCNFSVNFRRGSGWANLSSFQWFFRCVIAQAFCSQKSLREITLNCAKLR